MTQENEQNKNIFYSEFIYKEESIEDESRLPEADRRANLFARCILMPKEPFTEEFNLRKPKHGSKYDLIADLAKVFIVPEVQVVLRAKDLGLCMEYYPYEFKGMGFQSDEFREPLERLNRLILSNKLESKNLSSLETIYLPHALAVAKDADTLGKAIPEAVETLNNVIAAYESEINRLKDSELDQVRAHAKGVSNALQFMGYEQSNCFTEK